MSLDTHILSNIQDHLISGLSYRVGSGTARYVQEAKFVTYEPESSGNFSPNGSRVIRVRCSDMCFLEPNSCRLEITINNSSGAAMTPTAQPLAMFSRARLFLGGMLAEDWVELGSNVVIMDRMKSPEKSAVDSMEGHPLTGTDTYAETYQALPNGSSRTVMVPLPFGICSPAQQRWLPLAVIQGGMIMELELGSAGQAFAEANPAFTLSGVRLHANCYHIDPQVMDEYYSHLRSGNTLSIPYTSASATRHIITSANFTVTVTRQYSRLKQIYFVMVRGAAGYAGGAVDPIKDFFYGTPGADGGGQTAADAIAATTANNFEFQLQIGSKRIPERSVASPSEAFMRFKQAAGKFYGDVGVSILPTQYTKGRAIFGLDLERAGNQALYTGIDTRNGSLITLTCRNSPLGTNAGDHIVLVAVWDGIMELADGSVQILE